MSDPTSISGFATKRQHNWRIIMDKIYEIIDSSDEEMYFSIGLFLSLDEAVKAVEGKGIEMFDNLGDEYAVCHIKERKI